MITSLPQLEATIGQFDTLFHASKVRQRRSLYEFACKDLVIVKGDESLRNWPWNPDAVPAIAAAVRMLCSEEACQWPRRVALGCVQSGKTTTFFVLPIMYELFELQEPVIAGVPTEITAKDKWHNELLPAIKASRYANMLPKKGRGSSEAFVNELRFNNGAVLKWMMGRAGDEQRSSYTAKNINVTEADKMDESGEASRETDPISQIEARAESYGMFNRRINLECTVSVETGRIWREWLASTGTELHSPCVHCGEYVNPGREHVRGWQDAANERAAYELSRFVCPACGERINDEQRRAMNLRGVMLHRGQTISKGGVITGDAPPTFTFGTRWTAWHNLFWTIGKIGVDEFHASKNPDNVEMQRKLLQFNWALPWSPPAESEVRLDPARLARRQDAVQRGVIPEWAECVSMGVDLGKYQIHWCLIAWKKDGNGAIVDYGAIKVEQGPDEEIALGEALGKAIDHWLERGWATEDGNRRAPDHAWVDAGYKSHVVRATLKARPSRVFFPSMGRGFGQHHEKKYAETTSGGNSIVKVGLFYHFKYLKKEAQHEVELDSDYWKTWAARRLLCETNQRGSVQLFEAPPETHKTFADHLAAETSQDIWDPDKARTVTVWRKDRKNNHYFDALAYACGAGHYLGVRVAAEQPVQEKAKPPGRDRAESVPLDAHGRPFAVTDR